MTSPVQLLFDENIPPCIVTDLEYLLRHAVEEEAAHLKHVHTLYGELGRESTQGNWDESWIPSLAGTGWIVLAGDRGKTPGKGQKLPQLCAHYGITHILLSPVIHQRRKFQKLLTILSVWHELIALAKDNGCRRYFIEPASHLPELCGRGKIVEKTIPITDPPPLGMLFRK